MLLNVIVSALNEEKNIVRVLEGLENQVNNEGTELDKKLYGIVVVDNGSTDNTARVVQRFARHSKTLVTLVHEQERGIVSARLAGVRKVVEGVANINGIEYLAFCDSDVIVPSTWIHSMLSRFQSGNVDVLSYNGSFPHHFWIKVPTLTSKYMDELGTLFFPEETIRHYGANNKAVRFTRLVYSDFVRPPSGGFYAIRLSAYNQVGGYTREFTKEGKEVDGPTWRLYHKLMKQGARLQFVPGLDMTNSSRRLLGDPARFFGAQSYDQLSDLPQDIRTTDESRFELVERIARHIDFEPMQRYVVEYYIIMPCVCVPPSIAKNRHYFPTIEEKLREDIMKWNLENPNPKGEEVYHFCDILIDKYFSEIMRDIPFAKEKLSK